MGDVDRFAAGMAESLVSGYGRMVDMVSAADALKDNLFAIATLDWKAAADANEQFDDAMAGKGEEQAYLDLMQARVDAEGSAKKTADAQAEAERTADMQKEAERIAESFADPSESLASRLEEIRNLVSEGLLDPEAAERASQAAVKAFEGGLSSIDPFGSVADRVQEQIDEVREAISGGAIDQAMGNQLIDDLREQAESGAKAKAEAEAKEAEKQQAELDRRAEALRSTIETPAAVLAEKLAEAQALFAAGAITKSERNQAQDAAIAASKGEPASMNVGALAKGSAEAFRAELRGSESEAKQQIGLAKDQLKTLGAINENLTENRRAMEALQLGETV
jgi:ribosomal protein L19E